MFVVARPFGQLANRLLRAAHLAAAARQHGHAFIDLAFQEYADLFEGTRRDPFCRFPSRGSLVSPTAERRADLAARADRAVAWAQGHPRLAPLLRPVALRGWEERCDLDGPAFASLARRSACLLFDGWQFRTTAVARHADALRRHFSPAPAHAARVAAAAEALRTDAEFLIGVHVRRGDYAEFMGGRYFWPLATYAELMRRTLELHPGRPVRFVVCSNEPIDLAAFGDLPVTAGPGHLVEDLYLLARCDALLGPPSTFTIWASWHGGVPLWMVEDPGEGPSPGAFSVRSL